MPSFDKLTKEFKDHLAHPPADGALLEGALLIARQEYPRLSVGPFRLQLEQMALEAGERSHRAGSARARVAVLNHYLFEDLGFQGNRDDYYDAANSYWPDVMERRRGIPVSLAALYLELGWRLGLPLEGVNFPGHFLVGCRAPEGAFYLDAFEEGRVLAPGDLEDLAGRFVGAGEGLDPAVHLRPAGVADILHRMLANLKGIHARTGRLERALLCVDWMRLIRPEDLSHLRDRGLFLASLGRLAEVEEALSAYLEGSPRAADYSEIWQALGTVRARNPVRWN